ncbi:MAG: glutamine synthetase [Actinobacteria bacterium]|nr:MAG: glutamine synthetase [Actinomycetota bacterium]
MPAPDVGPAGAVEPDPAVVPAPAVGPDVAVPGVRPVAPSGVLAAVLGAGAIAPGS